MRTSIIRKHFALIVGLCFLNLEAFADGSTIEQNITPKPSTTLSAAANAANAAAVAAAAAAAAATAASNASAAAVDAINAILPPSQRVARPSNASVGQDSPVSASISEEVIFSENEEENIPSETASQIPSSSSQDINLRFRMPSEHSLVGLVGTYEVFVAAGARGDFTTGVQGPNFEPVESVSNISLADAITVSLGFSRDIHIAYARVDQAKAQTGQAKAFLLPSLLLNVKTGRERSAPGSAIDTTTGSLESVNNHSRSDASVTFTQPLLDIPSLYDWKRREIIEKSRQESVRSSQGDAYLDTVNAYLSLVSARIQVMMTSDYENQLQDLFEYIDKRSSAGLASHSDKERVRARSLNARSARIEQEAQQAAAGVEFVRLVNLAPSTMLLPNLEDLGISIVPTDVQQAMPLAIALNPDVAMLRKELQAARLDKKSAKGRYLPTFDLELSTTKSTHAGGAEDSQNDQRMMVAMNWSLFNGGGDRQLEREKSARINEIRYKLDDQNRRVLQAVTAQYATLEGVRQRIDAGYSELASISSAAESMSNRMLSGKQSLLDMLDVYSRYFEARTNLVNLHTQEMNAVAQIVRLIQGTPLSESDVNLVK